MASFFFCTVLVSVFSSCASSPSSSPSVQSNQESKLDTPDKNELENTVFSDGSKVEPKKNSDADRKKIQNYIRILFCLK